MVYRYLSPTVCYMSHIPGSMAVLQCPAELASVLAPPLTGEYHSTVLLPTNTYTYSKPVQPVYFSMVAMLWFGGRVVRMMDLWSAGRGFESWPPRCQVQLWASCWHPCAYVTKQYNLVPANGRWCLAAGKVTVGLASHWPRVTDISGSPPTGSRPRRRRWAPAY